MSAPPAKRACLGQRQKLQALAASQGPCALPTSELALHLQEQWSWGVLSAQALQKIATLAVRDMKTAKANNVPEPLSKLAELGSRGAFSNNCNRDMQNLIEQKSKVPHPLQLKLPFKGSTHLQRILLPHEMFHCMWKNYNGYFTTYFIPGLSKDGCSSGSVLSSIHAWWPLAEPASTIPLALLWDAVPTVSVGKVWAKCQLCSSWHAHVAFANRSLALLLHSRVYFLMWIYFCAS